MNRGEISRQGDFRYTFATTESIPANGIHFGWKIIDSQPPTPIESISANIRERLRKIDVRQTCAAVESVSANGTEVGGQIDGNQSRTPFKSVSADGIDGVWQRDSHQTSGIENIATDALDRDSVYGIGYDERLAVHQPLGIKTDILAVGRVFIKNMRFQEQQCRYQERTRRKYSKAHPLLIAALVVKLWSDDIRKFFVGAALDFLD